MLNVKHEFTKKIIGILKNNHPDFGVKLLQNSQLLQYLNIKTKAANRGSKSRAGFANHYAIYVLVEDYIKSGFLDNSGYDDYQGAMFSDLFKRQRELPFGSKLQNHALNHRLNEEFKKYFPASDHLPIIRDTETNRYWINENLLEVKVGKHNVNIALSVIEIINAYIEARQKAFNSFMDYCVKLIAIQDEKPQKAVQFIHSLLKPNVDARVFEIVSYAILKQFYSGKTIYWGWSPDEISIEHLTLFKTGRTNANDGGIDFVMRPLGRFFQVTEIVDAGKYFLDIDKVQRYPITFVVKSNETTESILKKVEQQAKAKYKITAIVSRYMNCVEKIINLPLLEERFCEVQSNGKASEVIQEIVLQSRIEFNVEAEEQDLLAFDSFKKG